jgi:hypothetical protein
MIVLNFGVRLWRTQRELIEKLAQEKIRILIEMRIELDPNMYFCPQIEKIVNGITLLDQEWTSEKILIVAPESSIVACALMAQLHAKMGHFPGVIRFIPLSSFEKVEIVDLNRLWYMYRPRIT